MLKKTNKTWVIIHGEVTNYCCTSQINNETTIKYTYFSNDQDILEEVESFVHCFLLHEFGDYFTDDNYDKKYLHELCCTVLQNKMLIIKKCSSNSCFKFYNFRQESDNTSVVIKYNERYDFQKLYDEDLLFKPPNNTISA